MIVAPRQSRSLHLAPDLGRERNAAERETHFRLARRWFNRAVRARNNKRFADAARLASATFVLGRGTYLADESLLLAAQASESARDERAAAAWYARLAAETPGSVYAPLARRRSARLRQSFDKKL